MDGLQMERVNFYVINVSRAELSSLTFSVKHRISIDCFRFFLMVQRYWYKALKPLETERIENLLCYKFIEKIKKL